MIKNNTYCMTPKEVLRALKIYRSVLQKQITYFPLTFTGLRCKTRELIALLDVYIEDYQDFFKSQKKDDLNKIQLTIFDKD